MLVCVSEVVAAATEETRCERKRNCYLLRVTMPAADRPGKKIHYNNMCRPRCLSMRVRRRRRRVLSFNGSFPPAVTIWHRRNDVLDCKRYEFAAQKTFRRGFRVFLRPSVSVSLALSPAGP